MTIRDGLMSVFLIAISLSPCPAWSHAGHGGGGGVAAGRLSSTNIGGKDSSSEWALGWSTTYKAFQYSLLQDGTAASFPLSVSTVPLLAFQFESSNWFEEDWGVALGVSWWWSDTQGLQLEPLGRASPRRQSTAYGGPPPKWEFGELELGLLWRGTGMLDGLVKAELGCSAPGRSIWGEPVIPGITPPGIGGITLFGQAAMEWVSDSWWMAVFCRGERLEGAGRSSTATVLHQDWKLQLEWYTGFLNIWERLSGGLGLRGEWSWVTEHLPVQYYPGYTETQVRPATSQTFLEQRVEVGCLMSLPLDETWDIGLSVWSLIPNLSRSTYQTISVSASVDVSW